MEEFLMDSCLSRGAAGNGRLFPRLLRATGDKTFLTPRAQFARALPLRGSG